MPTVGRTDTTTNDTWQSNTGSNNQYGYKVTMPESGLIQTLHVYVSGNGATLSGQLVLWNSSGAVVGSTGSMTISSGGTGVNGQAWQSGNLTTPYQAANGEVLYIGFWRAAASTANFSYDAGVGSFSPSTGSVQANVSSPSTLAVGSVTTGSLSAYADYVRGGLPRWNGSSWLKHPVKRWNGTSWLWHPVKRWNGSAWIWHA